MNEYSFIFASMRIRDEDKVKLVKHKAIESIVKDGFEGFSMNKLAKACGISVATLYIYFRDKDDLIISIANEEGDRMGDAFIRDFDANLSFEDGMRVQWANRYSYLKENPLTHLFIEQLRNSTYQQRFLENFMKKFKVMIHQFMTNTVERGEISAMPLEVFWSIAYAPLYSLIRFDKEGHSIGGAKFEMTDEVLWKTFDLVIKALKINTGMEDLNHILLFKTNISTLSCKEKVGLLLDKMQGVIRWNVALDDVDFVLRIISHTLSHQQIIDIVTNHGYECSELK